jgi:hypothetical protein
MDDERDQNSLEKACCELMYFLGSTARSIHDFVKMDEWLLECEEDDGGVLEPIEKTAMKEPIRKENVNKEAEFQDGIEKIKAEIFIEHFISNDTDGRKGIIQELKKISRPSALSVLKKLLQSVKDPYRTAEVLNALSSMNRDGKLEKELFMNFLKDKSLILRETALRAIARYKDREGFSILSSHLVDSNPKIRRQALSCISWFFKEECPQAVVRGLSDDDINVKKAALLVSDSLKIRQAVPVLIILLNSLDKEIQKGAIKALKNITGEAFGFDGDIPDDKIGSVVRNWYEWWHTNHRLFNSSE